MLNVFQCPFITRHDYLQSPVRISSLGLLLADWRTLKSFRSGTVSGLAAGPITVETTLPRWPLRTANSHLWPTARPRRGDRRQTLTPTSAKVWVRANRIVFMGARTTNCGLFHKAFYTKFVVCSLYRVFGLNLTEDVFFVKSNISRRKKQIFSKIKRC